MGRNYKNEAKWAKEKYERIEIKIDKEIGKEFKRKLRENKLTIKEFFENRIKNYTDSL